MSHSDKVTLIYGSAWRDGPPRGGFQSANTLLANLRRVAGVLVVGRKAHGQARALADAELSSYAYSYRPSGNWGLRMLRASVDAARLRRVGTIRRASVLVVDSEVFPPFLTAARMLKRPCLVYFRDFPNPARRRKVLLIARWASGLVVLSESMRRAILSMSHCIDDGDVTVVRNPLASSWFSGLERGACGARCRVSIVGTVSPKKNQMWFIEKVAPRLAAARLDCEVAFYGDLRDDPYCAQCQVRATRSGVPVAWKGYASDPFAIYRETDVLVQVSRTEGVARAVLEAGARGVPTVGLRSPGIDDYILDGVTGFVVGSEQEMTCRIAELVEDSALRYALGLAARDFVARRHGPAAAVEAFEDMLERLGNRRMGGECRE